MNVDPRPLFLAVLATLCGASFTVEPAVVCGISVLSDKVADVSSLEAWKRAYIRDDMTDQEKAIAIWKSVATYQHQDGPPCEYLGQEDVVEDAIKVFNVYGYAMCCNATAHVSSLARYCGLEARGWAVYHHSIGEIKYDGAWHHFDSSLISYFPKADGSIASIEEITAGVRDWYKANPEMWDGTHGIDEKLRKFEREDGRNAWRTRGPEILSRAPTYDARGWWPAGTHGWYATMQCFDGTTGDVPAYLYEYPAAQGYRVDIRLRRGERLTRRWSHRGLHINNFEGPGGGPGCMDDENGFLKRYDASFGGSLVTGRVGNGTHEYRPALDAAFADAVLAHDNLACGGGEPALRAIDASRPASVTLRMPSSYVYLGGALEFATRVGGGGHIAVDLSDDQGIAWKPVGEIASSGNHRLDLKPLVFRRYDYRLRLTFTGVGTGVDVLALSHDVQHSQRPLPALVQGANTITYSAGRDEGTITLESTTRTDHADQQVRFTQYRPAIDGLEGSPLRVTGTQGSITFPVETPGDLVRLRFGGHYQGFGETETWDYQVSFDEGATWRTAMKTPWQHKGRTAWTEVGDVPSGTRRALVRYLGHRGNADNVLHSFRIDADYREPHAGVAPVRVIYRWQEDGAAKEHVEVVGEAAATWTIDCAAKPVMTEIVLERD
ncbi:MAG: hypothetical protein H0X45_06055 [Planctomycetes bacterium]|nr:hypothetical protein [Planctomycetota bacterium]